MLAFQAVCVSRAKQQALCLLFGFFDMWSGLHPGAETQDVGSACCLCRGADVAFMQLSDTSSQLNCPAAFTQLTLGHRVTGKVFVWKQAKERIYISDIFSAPPASLPLHTDLFLFVSLLRIPDKYYVPEKATSKVGDMQKAFHDNCRV